MSTTDIRSKLVGEAAVIYPGPYLNQLRGERIERHCVDLLSRGIRNLVINFEETELINSIGISLLLEAIDAVDEANGRVVLASLNTTNQELFQVLGILSKVDVAHNEDSALAAFTDRTAGGAAL
ncbi:MAG: STAS domain-containing protein [Blastocatellia bacterium]